MSDSLDTLAARMDKAEADIAAGSAQHNDNVGKIDANTTAIELVKNDVAGVVAALGEAKAGNFGAAVSDGAAVLPWIVETAHRVELLISKTFGKGSAPARVTEIPALPEGDATTAVQS